MWVMKNRWPSGVNWALRGNPTMGVCHRWTPWEVKECMARLSPRYTFPSRSIVGEEAIAESLTRSLHQRMSPVVPSRAYRWHRSPPGSRPTPTYTLLSGPTVAAAAMSLPCRA